MEQVHEAILKTQFSNSVADLGEAAALAAPLRPVVFVRYNPDAREVDGIKERPITFDGGTSSVISDDLAAIVLDDRDISALSTSTPCMSLQIGGDTNGSWRISVYGGGGDSTATSFEIQCRVSGAWVTKSSFTPL
ncbi:hypothetical protein JKP88DRAFT_273619 [Tribonema minus]|uniref:Uncharacterized protein n=1 Tax=Tribonema minus TaxID=303371 RepID=A0A836CB27_9STRA|nr:hypothetical protein JKP88DRAFT_273619 [Tribonema minus]